MLTVLSLAGALLGAADTTPAASSGEASMPAAVERDAYAGSGAARVLEWNEEDGIVFRWWGGDGNGQAFAVAGPGEAARALTGFDSFISDWASRPGHPGEVLTAVFQPAGRRFQPVMRGGPQGDDWHPVGFTENITSRPRWSPDGSVLASNLRAPDWDRADIVVYDPHDMDNHRVVWSAPPQTSPSDWSPDGTRLLLWTYRSDTDQELRVLELGTGEVRRIDDPDREEAFADARFAADGETVLVASDTLSGLSVFGAINPGSPEFEPLLTGVRGEVEEWALSRDRQHAVVSVNQSGASVIYSVDLDAGASRRLGGLPTGVVDSLALSPDGARAAVVMQSWDGPGEIWSVSLAGQDAQRWFALPGPQGVPLVEPTVESFPTFDTVDGGVRRLDTVVWAPQDSRASPVIVYLHGGPSYQLRPIYAGDFQYRAAAQGIAVIAPNVRGSEGYGRDFLTLDDGVGRRDAIRDVGALLDWIDTDPRFDSGRVVVVGPSYGGLLSLAAAVQYSDRLRGVIAYSALADLVNLAEARPEDMRDFTRVEYGDARDETVRAVLETISPLQNADRIRVPALIAHGVEDDRAPVAAVDALVERLRAAGIAVEYLRFDGEGHGIRGAENVAAVAEAEEVFLAQVFEPAAD